MSYELRTPLTSISGFAEMRHGGYAGPLSKEVDSYVAAILDSTAKLGVLIDDVLGLTQQAATAPDLARGTVGTGVGALCGRRSRSFDGGRLKFSRPGMEIGRAHV